MAKYKRILKKDTKDNVIERQTFTKPINVNVVHMSYKAYLSRKVINPQLAKPMLIMTQRDPFRVHLVSGPPYTFFHVDGRWWDQWPARRRPGGMWTQSAFHLSHKGEEPEKSRAENPHETGGAYRTFQNFLDRFINRKCLASNFCLTLFCTVCQRCTNYGVMCHPVSFSIWPNEPEEIILIASKFWNSCIWYFFPFNESFQWRAKYLEASKTFCCNAFVNSH